METRFGRALARAHPAVFTLVAGMAGFCAYSAMYSFRKPFTAATYEQVAGWPFVLDYKIALILAQVAGYALSKFIGVKVISEIDPRRRATAILALIGLSWLALIGFALIPAPWNVAMLFLNGVPLGMIWGLVFGFMEGRRVSEVLASMLCASFIVSSGVVKSVGTWLMQSVDVDRFWMPAATGALFLPLLLGSVWVLRRLPPPSPADEAARVRRAPMTAAERASFLRAFAPGIFAIVVAYVLLNAFRDFRDNFAPEIWTALGYGGQAAVFSLSELPVALFALAGLALVIVIRDNRHALAVIHAMMAGGFALVGLSTLAFQAHLIAPLPWMILAGSGLYLAYNPVNAVLFDRLIAASGRVANAGFLLYVADSFGYLGSVALLLWRNFGQASLDWLQFFIAAAYATSIVGTVLTIFAGIYLHRRTAALAAAPSAAVPAQG
ncbi:MULTISPECIES: DUF5690 family protein [Sphingomonas]|uniref:DUF5690 family protein n=1 Tax=Sphingomonas TaxID=13687 RepID=UPI00082E8F44|nr:DUF5690 family protein [Sphingomonas sp. CCH10-B3]